MQPPPLAAAPRFAFKVHAPASKTHESVGSCGWHEWSRLALPDLHPIPPTIPMLLVIGQASASVGELFTALRAHPAVVAPVRTSRRRKLEPMHEVHWLDSGQRWERWNTAGYLAHWQRSVIAAQAPRLANGTAVLSEATPDYLPNFAAAPRARAIMPHARFVVVLRVRPLHPPFEMLLMLALLCNVPLSCRERHRRAVGGDARLSAQLCGGAARARHHAARAPRRRPARALPPRAVLLMLALLCNVPLSCCPRAPAPSCARALATCRAADA